MSFTIHIPAYWPWILGCLGCFVLGIIVGVAWAAGVFQDSIGRAFGWR